MKVDLELNLNEGTLKPYRCPQCSHLVCSCSDEIKEPQFDTKQLEINKEALRRVNKIDLSGFPLKS